MKTKTLPPAALKNLKISLGAKPDEEVPVVEPVVDPVMEDTEVVQPEETIDPQLAEITELKDQLSAVTQTGVELSETISGLTLEATEAKESLATSEKLVTNLSDNVRGIVNSMKVAMGHIELGEEVSGAALLKEYEFTSTKYVETLPTGSAVEEPKIETKEPVVNNRALQADYENMPFGSK